MSIMNMAPREAAQAWVDALRSGKYQQVRNALRTPDGFCCLGVACDIDDPESWGEPRGLEMRQAFTGHGQFSAMFPPNELSQHLVGGQSLWGQKIPYFARLNDWNGFTFAQIADVIEAVLINGQPWEDQPYWAEHMEEYMKGEA